MNNVLRIWSVEDNKDPMTQDFTFKLKLKLENGPSENDDILVVEWHPKGNAVLCGGSDFTIYVLNGMTGAFLACLSGHEGAINCAQFTPDGKNIVSSSEDMTIRVWSPIKQDCIQIIKNKLQGDKSNFHKAPINIFALHPSVSLVVSGDL